LVYAKNCGFDLLYPEHGVIRADLAMKRLDTPGLAADSSSISVTALSSVDQIGVGFSDNKKT
jgi:hypothetical protein